MTDIQVEQALFHRRDGQAPLVLARSEGFGDDWRVEAEALIVGFGERPAGIRCPQAVFAQPLGSDQVAIVHVADQESSGALACGFHFFVLPRIAYERFYGDPFAVARLLPPAWQARGAVPPCTVPARELPPRTVQEIQQVLKRLKANALAEGQEPGSQIRNEETSESPALLGGVQVLVDGGRIVFERSAADSGLISALWTLLPTRSRCHLWPASFAFGNALGFDALVVPRAQGEEYAGYTLEDQAEVYPQGNYELGLQIAVEADDQRALDSILNRRTWSETWRLAVTLIIMFFLLALAARILIR
jgi:hypothetical protein